MTEDQVIQDIVDWFDATFPNVHPMAQVRKLDEEWEEFLLAETPEHKAEEAADVAIVIVTILRKDALLKQNGTFFRDNFLQKILDELNGLGYNLMELVQKKMVVNKQRAIDGRWK